MIYHPTILVDTGLLVAFYDSADSYHNRVVEFFAKCTSRLITAPGCIAAATNVRTQISTSANKGLKPLVLR